MDGMDQLQQPRPRFRFGVFELDTRTGELRRKGLRVRLHAQPAELLRLLLLRPGEMVSREEIREALWPAGNFVDYEQGLNSAVNRLRAALGDEARNPRFVETVARRGYRFVAPVGLLPEAQPPQPAPPEQPADEPAPQPAAAPEPIATPEPAQATAWHSRMLAQPADLPAASPRVVRTLLLLLQGMYLAFYVAALANLPEVGELVGVLRHGAALLTALEFSAALLIPVRAFLLCALLFRAPRLAADFLRIWPFLLVADLFWAPAPFLLLHHLAFGVALACVPLLVYSPFAQRALVLMLCPAESI